MTRYLATFILVTSAFLAGCTGLNNAMAPEVRLTRLEPLPSQGMEQRFAIGLRVLNPNTESLVINGLYYSLSLQGHRVLSGVTDQVTDIPPYGEAEVEIQASADLIGGLRAITRLLNQPDSTVFYELTTRVDTGGWRPVTVTERGEWVTGKGAR